MDSKILAGYIDHTILKPEATSFEIMKLCEEAIKYSFASVCINPVFVPLAYETLKDSGVSVCTVVGFPLGANTTAVKAEEARTAVLEGALEIDMVIALGFLREGQDDEVSRDIAAVVKIVQKTNPDAIVKVIIETCLLTDSEKIKACKIAEATGAHFVKTSTGFAGGGATLEDVRLMRSIVAPQIGVKASGGIRSAIQALEFINAGAARIGTSSGVKIIEEFLESK